MKISKIFRREPDENDPSGHKPGEVGRGQPDEQAGLSAQPADTSVSGKLSPQSEAIVSRAMHKGPPIVSAKLGELYDEAVAKSRQLYSPDTDLIPSFLGEVGEVVEKLAGMLRAGDTELIVLALGDYPKAEGHLYYHVVNTCVISLVTGIGLGYERVTLMELGTAAFLHDIGIRSFDALHKKEVLEKEDYSKILQHPEEGVKLLNQAFKDLSPKILEAVAQEHERADGSGYPKGLVSEEINEYAQIVGLADVYEALMHSRPYRDKYTSLEAIKAIVKDKEAFSVKAVKSLIEGFGMYPLGTLVRLNTKEVGVVLKNSHDYPARPLIDIVIDSYGKEMKQSKSVNLAENTVVYIEDCYKSE
jgi:response regulator RpfG family c-di-GMP phosphodiesterase